LAARTPALHDRPMTVLHQGVEPETEASLLAPAFSSQLGVCVGSTFVGGVTAMLPVEIDRGVARIACAGILRSRDRLKPLQTRPGINESTIDGEVGVTDPAVFAGQGNNPGEEQL